MSRANALATIAAAYQDRELGTYLKRERDRQTDRERERESCIS